MRTNVTRVPSSALANVSATPSPSYGRCLFHAAQHGTWLPLESLRSSHMEIRCPRELPTRRRFTWARVTSRVGLDGEYGTQIPFQLGLGEHHGSAATRRCSQRMTSCAVSLPRSRETRLTGRRDSNRASPCTSQVQNIAQHSTVHFTAHNSLKHKTVKYFYMTGSGKISHPWLRPIRQCHTAVTYQVRC